MSRLDKIQRMLEADPQDAFLNFSLAMEYVKEGRSEEALAQFSRVVELDRDVLGHATRTWPGQWRGR